MTIKSKICAGHNGLKFQKKILKEKLTFFLYYLSLFEELNQKGQCRGKVRSIESGPCGIPPGPITCLEKKKKTITCENIVG